MELWNWQDTVFRTGHNTDADFSVSGGDEKQNISFRSQQYGRNHKQ
jgi:hypothetical protein